MTALGLVPRPAVLARLDGGFVLTPDCVLVAAGAAADVAGMLAEALRLASGWALPVLGGDVAGPAIRLAIVADVVGEEAYRLRVDEAGVLISAGAAHGLFHGMQTLLQLLPESGWLLPGVAIEDWPRFAWRDLMLDCSRYFMPIGFIRQLIDAMALHKLNRFHWHLTDDQGWRIEIRKYPRLTEIGAWRRRTQLGHKRDLPTLYDDLPHGGFYSQEEIRALVAYAAARHVTVVPEIDMPGHVQSAIAAYPMLAGGSNVGVSEQWAISEHVLAPDEYSIGFMQDVLAEVMALFPGRHIHIGGDECLKVQWRRSAAAQALIRAQGLGDEDGLQSWFIGRIGAFLRAHGRVLVGWDEILEGGLAEGAVVMSWRGMEGGIAAVRAGHQAIMTPQSHVYLDYYQVADHAGERLAIRGTTTLATCLGFEPVPAELSADEAARVIGTGAKLWTEYVPTPEHAAYMLFPRACALAEVAWSPAGPRDFAEFHGRMRRHMPRLAAMGLHGRPLDPLDGGG